MKPPTAVLRALGLRAWPDAPEERGALVRSLHVRDEALLAALVSWAHAEASAVASPPRAGAWAALCGVSVATLRAWRRAHAALDALPVAPSGKPALPPAEAAARRRASNATSRARRDPEEALRAQVAANRKWRAKRRTAPKA